MALVIASVTSFSLFLIRQGLHAQITNNLSLDLSRSVIAFQNLQAERLVALERENALLANLPTLKALMTSSDDFTIQDGAIDFWQLSGNDLFALASPTGRIVAAYTKGSSESINLRGELTSLITSQDKHYLIDGNFLYACTVQPLYFGRDDSGTLLGYVISGVSIERTVRQISAPTGVEAAFVSGGQVVASTLARDDLSNLTNLPLLNAATPQKPVTVILDKTRFLAATEDLSSTATSSLQLVVFKSYEPAEQWINRIDRIVLSAGFFALLLGTALMIGLSRVVTRPLEELSKSVHAFGIGDVAYRIPTHGTQEVQHLSTSFAGMRDEIKKVNAALLEIERLATIGRMASSVSHDLRHYLAAIYANSEFLAMDRLSPKERAEIFNDIRTAVHGTTDMIESLLVFSRTGNNHHHAPELMATLVERAAAVMRQHPDAEGVTLITQYGDPTETETNVDGKQIERAIFNLLLNACQAARIGNSFPTVSIALEVIEKNIVIRVKDNGAGVPETIRNSLFDPFVSEGKQKGTGLGLTLVSCIASEHHGEATLISSIPGETIFEIKMPREFTLQDDKATDSKRHVRVNAHE